MSAAFAGSSLAFGGFFFLLMGLAWLATRRAERAEARSAPPRRLVYGYVRIRSPWTDADRILLDEMGLRLPESEPAPSGRDQP